MNLIARAKNILLTPKSEWEAIKPEPATVTDLFTQYALILAAIPAVASFVGLTVIGISVPFLGHIRVPFGSSLTNATLTYGLALAGTFGLAFVIDALAPTFGAKKDLVASAKAAVYANTASWVAGALLIIPSLYSLSLLASLYSLYLLWLGMKTLKECPAEKQAGYFVATLVAAIVIMAAVGFVAGRTGGSFRF